MKKILLLLLLATSFAYSQGGPDVDKITFRGQVTTAVRDQITVETGTTMLIHNVTTNKLEIAGDDQVWTTVGDGLQEGLNTVPSGITMEQGVTNKIELIPENSGILNNEPAIRMVGGAQGSETYFVMRNNLAEITGYSIAEIDAATNASIVTKEWVLAKIAAGGGGGGGSDNLGDHTATQSLNMAGFGINNPGILVAGTSNMTFNTNSSINVNTSFVVPNLPYNSVTWDGLTSVPTRNDVRDAIEDLFLFTTNSILYRNVYKLSNFLVSTEDIRVTSGVNKYKKSIITYELGGNVEGVLEDADCVEGQSIMIENNGSGNVVIYFAQGESGMFLDGNGTIGNQWTLEAGKRGVGIEDISGNIRIDAGTVSTRTF